MLDKVILIAYIIFLIVGALIGFLKGSMMSLAMGLGCALMVVLGLWLLKINIKGAWIMLSFLGGLLSLVFLLRIIKSQSFLPAGILLIVSIVFLAYSLIRLSQHFND